MTEALKIAAAGIVCAIVCMLIKQLRPELAPFVQVGGIIIISALLLSYIQSLLASAEELFEQFNVLNLDYLSLLIKILGVAVITKIGADMCNDSGNTALAGSVELAGKVLILFMCFSLIGTVTELAGGLIR